ncbi:MAG: YfhO family protein [Kiritimatiellae bacterium]|nr:YfhO family protein [Kiritimatiellia bacterium]
MSTSDPSDRGVETSGRPWFGVVLLGMFALLAAIALSPVLLRPDRVLDFNDGNIESALSPAYALPGALLRVWDNQFFFGQGGKQFALCSASLGEWLFGPHHYRREAVLLMLTLVAGAVYWTLRQFGIRRAAAAVTAGAVMLSGAVFSFAVLGLTVRGGALGFATLALGFLERGRRRRGWLSYALGGGCLGLAIAETPDIGVFFALALAAAFLWLHWPATPTLLRAWGPLAGRFAVVVASSAALALQTLSVMFATQIEGVQQGAAESPAARYDWATQWSLPPNETWDLVAGTFYGASVRSSAAPYRGRIGRTPGWSPDQPNRGFRNFAMTGYHLGVVPAVLLLAGWLAIGALEPARRRLAVLSLGGAIGCLVLAWGRYTPVYRLVFSLPYLDTIRNPEKWMMPFMLFAALGLGVALDALLQALRAEPAGRTNATAWQRALARAAGTITGLALVLLAGTLIGQDAFRNQMALEGYTPEQIRAAWSTAVGSSIRVLLVASLLSVAARLWRRHGAGARRAAPAVLATLAVVGTADLLTVNRYFVAGRPWRHLLEPNPLTDFVRQQHNTGRFKLLPESHPALNHLRMTYLQAAGCDLFDPVSVSRMPTDYAALFSALQAQPLRLWTLGAIRYVVTLPGGTQQLNQLDGDRGRFREIWSCGMVSTPEGALRLVTGLPVEQQVLRIAEFGGARPKWFFPVRVHALENGADAERRALAVLRSNEFDPLTESVLITSGSPPSIEGTARVVRVLRDEPAAAEIEVECAADTLLVRATRYDPDWRVSVDGAATPLLRVDYLLQGVRIPAGRHRIVWEYRPDPTPLHLAVAGRMAWLLGWVIWLVQERRRHILSA